MAIRIYVRNAFTGCKGRYCAYYDGISVRVWDSVADFWTVRHNLTPHQVQYVISRSKVYPLPW